MFVVSSIGMYLHSHVFALNSPRRWRRRRHTLVRHNRQNRQTHTFTCTRKTHTHTHAHQGGVRRVGQRYIGFREAEAAKLGAVPVHVSAHTFNRMERWRSGVDGNAVCPNYVRWHYHTYTLLYISVRFTHKHKDSHNPRIHSTHRTSATCMCVCVFCRSGRCLRSH